MSKLPALAAALLTLASITTGCALDMTAMVDIPSATVITNRGSSSTSAWGPGYDVYEDSRYEHETVIITPPVRRAPGYPTYGPAPQPPVVTAKSSDAINPVLQAFTANPSNLVPAGQPITFTVVAHDPQNQPVQYNWSATGGTLSTNSGQMVVWNPPDKAGLYTVSTIITNARGGAVTGSQNLTVKADGSITQVAGTPVTEAAPVAQPEPVPVAQASSKPIILDECGCEDDPLILGAKTAYTY